MIDIRLSEKLRELKARFIDGDESAKKQIAQWEKRIRELSAVDDFSHNATVQEIRNLLKARIREYVVKRVHGDNADAGRLKDKEDECRYLFSLFSPQYEGELETIDKLLDRELS